VTGLGPQRQHPVSTRQHPLIARDSHSRQPIIDSPISTRTEAILRAGMRKFQLLIWELEQMVAGEYDVPFECLMVKAHADPFYVICSRDNSLKPPIHIGIDNFALYIRYNQIDEFVPKSSPNLQQLLTRSHCFSAPARNMGAFPTASPLVRALMSTRFPNKRLITNYFMTSSYRWNFRDHDVGESKFCVKVAIYCICNVQRLRSEDGMRCRELPLLSLELAQLPSLITPQHGSKTFLYG